MKNTSLHLTVYFDCPFWVGVFERTCDGEYQTCKITFGSEPKDQDIQNYILREYRRLPFGRTYRTEKRPTQARINPKRLQRQVRLQTRECGLATKAQQALQKDREARAMERKQETSRKRKVDKETRFMLKQLKKQKKRKGH